MLERDTIPKAAYKKKHIIGGLLTVSEASGECGTKQAGRHVTRALPKSLHLVHKLEVENTAGPIVAFEVSKAHPQ